MMWHIYSRYRASQSGLVELYPNGSHKLDVVRYPILHAFYKSPFHIYIYRPVKSVHPLSNDPISIMAGMDCSVGRCSCYDRIQPGHRLARHGARILLTTAATAMTRRPYKP